MVAFILNNNLMYFMSVCLIYLVGNLDLTLSSTLVNQHVSFDLLSVYVWLTSLRLTCLAGRRYVVKSQHDTDTCQLTDVMDVCLQFSLVTPSCK